MSPHASRDKREHSTVKSLPSRNCRREDHSRENQDLSRRTLLKGGGAALAELTVLRVTGLAQAFGDPGDEVIPWLDQPAPNPIPENVGNLLKWETFEPG
jgi:hypothetical protein